MNDAECRDPQTKAELTFDVDLDGIDECKTRTFKRHYIIGLDKLNSDLSAAVASVHFVPEGHLDRDINGNNLTADEEERRRIDRNSVKRHDWVDLIAGELAARYPSGTVTHRIIGGDLNIERCVLPKHEADFPVRQAAGIEEPPERSDCTERAWWTSLDDAGYEDSVFAYHGALQPSMDAQYQDGNIERKQRIDFVFAQRVGGDVGFAGASHDVTCGEPTNCDRLRNEQRYSDHRLVWARTREPLP